MLILAGRTVLFLLLLPGADTLDRSALPIHEPDPPTITTLDARDAAAPPRFEVQAPAGAPNVVVVLIDDIGFGASSAFGGPCRMPNLERMAAAGLRYNRLHTTALCSPTRLAMLTDHDHHANNVDRESSVSPDYQPGLSSAFTDRIIKVTVEQK